jgi:hypothetical protein
MIEEKENKNEELEVLLEEPEKEKEVSVPSNPIEDLVQQEPSNEKEIDKTYENEREVKLEEKKPKPIKEIPEYSEDLPYSLKVRKRIQKEVAKRAEAEQKLVEMEERMSKMEKKTYDIANKSLSNQLSSVSNELKTAIEEGNTEKQVKLYENMAELRSQMTKTEDYAAQVPNPKEKTEKKAPPLATEWVKENSAWFNKPGYRKETAMAYGIDAELTEEGWDVHDPGYYDEMTKRLKSSGLPYFNKSQENTSKTEQNVVQKNNRVQSPVAGVSRKKGTSSNRVKLTSDDLATAKNFGIDITDEAALKRFAKEVKSFSDTGQ